MTARYDRAPSPALLELLAEDGFLSPLRVGRTVAGLAVDVQFREGDEVHVYCGLTRLLGARLQRNGVRIQASPTYTSQPCAAGLFRTWRPDEGGLGEAVWRYLDGVVVDGRWTDREGRVQALWMGLTEPWVSLDREAVIGRESAESRGEALEVPAVLAAHEAVAALAAKQGWKRPASPKGANELDQLAIDDRGRLVLVELKDARASEVVTAPLQALRYAWEWHAALDVLLPSLQALRAARMAVGLMPPDTPELTGELRAVVAWGEGSPSPEVLRRLAEVKATVDRHFPPGIPEVEVWCVTPEGPRVVALHGPSAGRAG